MANPEKLLKSAQKKMKKSVPIFGKRDYPGAIQDLKKAEIDFKRAKDFASLAVCYSMLADCYEGEDQLFMAGSAVSNAIEAKVRATPDAIATMVPQLKSMGDRAVDCYRSDGRHDAAADVYSRVAEHIAPSNLDAATGILLDAFEIMKVEDRLKSGIQFLKKAALLFMKHGEYDQAIETFNEAIEVYGQIRQNHNISKSVLALVLIHLKRGDLDSANSVVAEHAQYIGNDEGQVIDKLLMAFQTKDPELLEQARDMHILKVVDAECFQLSRKLFVQTEADDVL
ncbi:Soluble NSF attachment protein SNAP [Carpediemonas membranifera]|uniref:Gamma-soluble NSF attachment protein n=1 Tax=Carpediemonas membranifera TaxID=201153 RepID=A0A8J6ASN2_9EUKA|nr:Soluble NSF attachment protein SNAP [Carpediemonas membranifera]|eukprot:KAG9393073.1 Soluble NSF attachment protein SNAP [Carpediemonas membranifera]